MVPFQLLTQDCVETASEYLLKVLYMCLSSFSILCVMVVLGRIIWRRRTKQSTTAIGRLVEHLIVVGGCLDICFHFVDVLFALDCNAPPLLFLLTKYKVGIHTESTLPYNIVKEGFGLLSLSWHAHLAYCLYSWIVLKMSAGRLQRRSLPLLLLAIAAITGVRMALYMTLREPNLLGLYLSMLLYDVVLLPGVVFAMMRWYFLTIAALRAGDRQEQQQDADTVPHVSVDMSHGGGSSHKRSSSSSLSTSREGSLPLPPDALPPPVQVQKGRSLFFSSFLSRGSEATRSGGVGPRGGSNSRSNQSGGSSVGEGHLPTTLLPSSQSASGIRPAATMHRVSSANTTRKERHKNASIIRRLLRISFSVSVVWLLIALLDIVIWAHFYTNDQKDIRPVFLVRMVVMRAVGAIDAIMLGDLFFLCLPCSRALKRLAKRLRRHPASPPVAAAQAPSSVVPMSVKDRSSVEGGGNKSPTHSSVAAKFFPPNHADANEEEAARMAQALEAINRARAPTRRMKSLEIFCSTWNMGGVDAESLETVSFKTTMLPLWLPQGYSLYVLGVQECQCLKEFRDAVHSYLGGPQAFTVYADALGDDQILHGFIAITVFVRASDVADGAFRIYRGAVNKVAAGISLGALGHAPNKGMVGLSCRYYDTSLSIITAHFASDSKGRTRVDKRNRHANTTLQELSLHDDSDDFEVHHQHHAVICLGDFNYRLSPSSPKEVLRLLAQTAQSIAQQQQHQQPRPHQEGQGDHGAAADVPDWRKVSYQRFFQLPTKISFNLGNMPELPPCLGTRRTSASSSSNPSSFYGGSSYLSGGWPTPLFGARAPSLFPSQSTLQMERQVTSSLGMVEGDEESVAVPPPVLPDVPDATSMANSSILSTDDCEAAWEWVRRLDELTRSMRERAVFYNFVEGIITFPPSYRWHRGLAGPESLAGDYTDEQQLWAAYSTFVVDPPKLFSMPTLMFAQSVASGGGGGGGGGGQDRDSSTGPSPPTPSSSSGATTSARTPSYTDRILTHSLPGKGSNLRWRHYDMMDLVCLSDHRPVSCHLTLFVDADCRGFHILPSPPPEAVSPTDGSVLSRQATQAGVADKDDLVMFHISLSHPRVTLKGGQRLLNGLTSGTTAHEATVLFPLVSEDPLAEERKASSLGEVMLGGGGGGRSTVLLRGQPSTSSLGHYLWSSFPIQLKTVGSLRFSEHLLLKVSNGKGKELGQTVIPVALGMVKTDGLSYAATTLYQPVHDEMIEGAASVGTRGDPRRFRFPLTSGGALKGWITLTVKTTIKHQAASSLPKAPSER